MINCLSPHFRQKETDIYLREKKLYLVFKYNLSDKQTIQFGVCCLEEIQFKELYLKF